MLSVRSEGILGLRRICTVAIKFVVEQDPATRLWHWRLRSAANDRDWACSSRKGYTRRERAVAACTLLWEKLSGCKECPRIQINASKVPALVEAFQAPSAALMQEDE